ncbi:MAG: transcriptional repressor [Bacteroidales bacterium]|nr:transcriptional repressor [Bacteroidales bacterium]
MLAEHNIRVTANRLLVLKALGTAGRPLSMAELEGVIATIDKSNIFRTLNTFRDNDLVHVIEDGSDGVRYELCLSHSHGFDDDLHAHFFCERCRKTFCLPSNDIPQPSLPQGYKLHSLNYLLKGLCPACSGKK